MDELKLQTFKIKKESFQVSQAARDNLKEFNNIRKKILEAISDEEVTVKDVSVRIQMNPDKTLYYMMTLLKFGNIQVVGIDDMDEYYIYKIKK